MAWLISTVSFPPSDRNDALTQTTEDVEKSDLFDLLTKSRVRRPGNDTEPVQHLPVLKLHPFHPEDSFFADTAHRLMFVRLTPETGPPLAI